MAHADDSVYERRGLGSAVHDLHARLGSINIAVTAVTELGLDGDLRDQMLTTASEEVVRASAELACIGALAACLVDHLDSERVDLGALITDVTEVARLSGLDAKVIGTQPGATVWAAGETLRRSFAALLRMVAGHEGGVEVEMLSAPGEVALRLARIGSDSEALPAVVAALVEAIGARVDATDSELRFAFEVAG